MTDVTDTPTTDPLATTAPPKEPIPLGITSFVMLGTSGLATAIGAIMAVVNGDYSTESIIAFAYGLVTVVTWAWGRFKQAEARYRAAPSPLLGATSVLNYAQDELEQFNRELTFTGADDGVDDGPVDEPPGDEPNTPVGLGGGAR